MASTRIGDLYSRDTPFLKKYSPIKIEAMMKTKADPMGGH
jgi:hypothetical protein